MLLAVIALIGPGSPLHAQEAGALTTAAAAPAQPEYSAALAAGVAAQNEQRWEEARACFERAHALRPSARTLRALGICDFALDRFTLARRELVGALRHPDQPLSEAGLHEEVQELVDWMLANLGTVELNYTPANALAKLDGSSVYAGDLTLEPGEHLLVISAGGFVTRERTFQVLPAQTLSLTVDLTAAPEQALTAPVTQAALPPKAAGAALATNPEPAAAVWPWLLGSAGAVALISGTTLFVLGQNDIAAVENARKDVLLSEIESAHDRAPWLTGVGIGLGVAGLACVSVAAFTLIRERAGGERARVSMRVAPTGVLFAGAF